MSSLLRQRDRAGRNVEAGDARAESGEQDRVLAISAAHVEHLEPGESGEQGDRALLRVHAARPRVPVEHTGIERVQTGVARGGDFVEKACFIFPPFGGGPLAHRSPSPEEADHVSFSRKAAKFFPRRSAGGA